MKTRALIPLVLVVALPAVAREPDPAATSAPPAARTKAPFKQRVFVGGGVGASFGTIDYVSLAPLVGFHVVPRLDLGIQPFYRWTRDGRYAPSVSTSDYGANLFARVRIVRGFFGEADVQYLNYEYAVANGGTLRDTNTAFLAGAGYAVSAGRNVGVYVSALYDFSYDDTDPFRPYDSPLRLQVGVSVGF